MPTAPSQLTCPACSQVFLGHLVHAHVTVVCPACGFSATAGQFQARPDASSQDRRKKEGHRFAPIAIDDSSAAPVRATRLSAVPPPKAAPRGWEVRDYPATQPPPAPMRSPFGAPRTAPLPPHPPSAPEMPNWELTQGYLEQRESLLPALPEVPEPDDRNPDPMVARGAPPPPSPLARSRDLMPSKSGQHAPLNWQGTGLAVDETTAADFVPKKKFSLVWPAILFALLLMGGALWVLMKDLKQEERHARSLAPEVRKAAKPVPVAVAQHEQQLLPPGPPAFSKTETRTRVKDLLEQLSSASTPEQRLACIADGTVYREELERFWSTQKEPLQFMEVKCLQADAWRLPGPLAMQVCEVQTNRNETGTAITGLIVGKDGVPRLDWPMLQDSLEHKLSRYMEHPDGQPQWVWLGLKRSFGFGEPGPVREQYHAMDIQGTADGADRTVALVAKNQPIGRSIDAILPWNQLMVARVLLHWTNVDNQPRLIILDAEVLETGLASP